MKDTVALAGSLDTKGNEYSFVKDLIEKQGFKTLLIDFGVLNEPTIAPDISREEIAKLGGSDISEICSGNNKDIAMKVMCLGLPKLIKRLYVEKKIHGMLALGGSGGTTIASAGMRALPIGVPKVMVSTISSGDIRPYVDTKDINFFPSVVDIAGINSINSKIFENASSAICGMLKYIPKRKQTLKPLLCISMFGNTTPCVDSIRYKMEENGYEVLVFHSTGMGGRIMEDVITEKNIVGSIDITTTELADEVCGGLGSAGPERCFAASQKGIPVILVPGCVDMANFASLDTVPEKYKNRLLYQWNPTATLLRTNVQENILIGKMIAHAANIATGKVVIILPLKGVSMLDSEGQAFWDPEADEACFNAIKKNINQRVILIDLDNNINDATFSKKVSEIMINNLLTN